MRNCVLTEKSRLLSRGAAILVLSGFGAGCSADMSRFTYKDFTTGSVNQQRILRKAPQPQPFPEANQTYDTGSLDAAGTDTGFEPVKSKSSVSRQALAPVTTTAAAAPKAAAPKLTPARQTVTPVELAAAEEFGVADEPVKAAPKIVKKKVVAVTEEIDDTTTGTVAPKVRKIELAKKNVEPLSVSEEADALPKVKKLAPKAAETAAADKGGWSAEGGTPVTIREGETLYNLSKRFGVPVASLLKANGLKDASEVQAGQKIIVPAYRYSHDSDVSAPDSNFDTAAAKSSSGTVYDVSEEKVPLPKKAPERQNVAVLPSTPQVKQKAAPQLMAESEPKTTSKTDRIKPVAEPVSEEVAAAPVKTAPVEVAEAPKAAPKKAAGGEYAVAQGDSLYKIAKAHGVSVDALKSANGLEDGKLKIGQPLRIPAAGEKIVAAAKPVKVDPIETSAAPQAVKTLKPVVQEAKVKEYTPPKSDDVKAEADQDDSSAPNATGISKLRWPVRGRTVSGFGQREGGTVSDGVNISVPEGTPIKAAENGVVIYAGNGLKEFGNTVLVRHANGLVTVYGYAKDIEVKRGQTIKRGQELGKTGISTAAKVPMLHFQVRKDSAPVNPSTYLE